MNRFVFYPVGQGLFYSGQLSCHPYWRCLRNFIFDCGGDEPYIGEAVDRFADEIGYDRVNLCVISHLHRDHYNGLTLLKNKGIRINNIVLPYLPYRYPALKFIYIVGQYYSESKNLDVNEDDVASISLMSRFYRVQESNPNDRRFCERVQTLEEYKIENGFKYFQREESISLYNDKKWVFELFNKSITDEKWEEYNNKLNDLLAAENIRNPIDLFPNSVDKLVEIYKTVFGKNLNVTSIVMKHYYQGRTIGYYPVQDNGMALLDRYFAVKYPFVFERRIENVSVLTGDAEFDDKLWQHTFEDAHSISVLQVPHHGARTNWNKLKLPSDIMCKLVISYGLGNRHKHPNSDVVKDILEMPNCELVSVNQATQYEYSIENK